MASNGSVWKGIEKQYWIYLMIVLGIGSFVLILNHLNIFPEFTNNHTIIVEIIVGVSVAVIVYGRTRYNEQQGKELLDEIETMLEQEQKHKKNRIEYLKENLGMEVLLAQLVLKEMKKKIDETENKLNDPELNNSLRTSHKIMLERWKRNVLARIEMSKVDLEPEIIDQLQSVDIYIDKMGNNIGEKTVYPLVMSNIISALDELDRLSEELPYPDLGDLLE